MLFFCSWIRDKRKIIKVYDNILSQTLGIPFEKIETTDSPQFTLLPGVLTYVYIGIKEYLDINHVQLAFAFLGVFYISENFSKSFLQNPNIRVSPIGIRAKGKIKISLITRWNGKEVNSNGAIFFQ